MAISNLKGQFLQGQVQTIKAPSKHRPVYFDNEMPSIEAPFRANGKILPKRGAI